jgi:hypothetical protein
MHGKITFTDTESLVEFLAAWTGKSTAIFEVVQVGQNFVLTFKGGF